jgi:aminopeptidase N
MIRFNKIWQYFSSFKSTAFLTDQFESTHALQVDCLDTHQAESLFDDFVSSKGAAIFRYLHSLIGTSKFWSVLAAFVKKYGNGNAGYAEFKEIFIEVLKNEQDITAIKNLEPFITQKGVNRLNIVLNFFKNRMLSMILTSASKK